MKRTFAALAATTLIVTALAGCGTREGDRALTGAGIGAAAGAVGGAMVGDPLAGAAVGGAVGAGVGAATTPRGPNDHN